MEEKIFEIKKGIYVIKENKKINIIFDEIIFYREHIVFNSFNRKENFLKKLILKNKFKLETGLNLKNSLIKEIEIFNCNQKKFIVFWIPLKYISNSIIEVKNIKKEKINNVLLEIELILSKFKKNSNLICLKKKNCLKIYGLKEGNFIGGAILPYSSENIKEFLKNKNLEFEKIKKYWGWNSLQEEIWVKISKYGLVEGEIDEILF